MRHRAPVRLALGLIAVLLILSMAVPCAGSNIQYETLRYHVDIAVGEEEAYTVTETITVNFLSPAHGIYRHIPTKGDIHYRDEEGNHRTLKGRLHITKVDTGEVKLDKSMSGSTIVLRLGDSKKRTTGEFTYVIRYTARVYEDGTDEFDHVYWNLIPPEWQTPIETASFTVALPKDFDDEALEWITGPVGSDRTDEVTWRREGDVLYGAVNRPLDAYEGVTVRIVLPDGYFSAARMDDWKAVLANATSILSALIALLLFFRYGKDEKVIPVVEFYPPDDLSPSEAGFVLNGKANKDDVLSLVPYLAHKGYMHIHRLEPKKRLIGKPQERFELQKVEDLPANAPSYQQTFFNGLFEEGSPVSTDDVPTDFGSAFEDSQKQLGEYFNKSEERKIYRKSSRVATGAGCLLTFVPFFGLGMLIAFAMLSDAQLNRAAMVTIAAMLVSSIATIFMRKRTAYSAALLGRLQGFRNFIKSAELDRIELLVHDDPEYFYHVLPYAYVFGLTKEWMRHFEHLSTAAPSWYSGDPRAFQAAYIMSSINAVTTSLPTATRSSGGGFSSGSSGGGFSGGGHGGGGGGAW